MPASKRVISRADQSVGAPNSKRYEQAQSAVAGTSSLSQAVEQGKFLHRMTAKDQAEVRAVLAALPADVERDFMNALREALRRGAKVAFVWHEHPEEGRFHTRSRTDDDGTVHLLLWTPHGSSFRQSTSTPS
jgi:predicted lactoylglutathione lyase